MAIVILPDSTRIDLVDDMAREVYGIADPDAPLDSTTDAYRWRWAMDELVQQMSEEEFRDALDYIARAHGVDVIEMDSVAYTIMDALGCTVDAAQGLREWVFDVYSDTLEDCEKLRFFLNDCCEWVADDAALKALGYTYTLDGTLWDIETPDGIPVKCEDATVYADASFGYLVIFN